MRHAALVIPLFLLSTHRVAAEPPPQATAAFARAQVAMAGHDCEAAFGLLREAIEAAPDYWEAHRSMGECFLKLNKPDEARPHLEQALRLKPGDAATQALLTRVTALQKAEAEQMAQAIQARDRLAKRPPEKAVQQPRPLGDYARVKPSPATRAATDAPKAPLDSTRARVTSVFRPRMVAVAPALKSLVAADRRYREGCGQAGQTSGPTRQGGYDIGQYISETAWRGRFEAATIQRNEETPTCRALAGEIRALSSRLAAAMDGVDRELASAPPVNPSVMEEVFARLASELW
jgi:tetratricopeptide (TPR) repeat protein